jgi:hypothetical protein
MKDVLVFEPRVARYPPAVVKFSTATSTTAVRNKSLQWGGVRFHLQREIFELRLLLVVPFV